MPSRAVIALLLVAAAARILLAVAAMPPYAGLDEAWHVARVAFVAREHRQPSVDERSIPPYIGDGIRGTHMPSFAENAKRWPAIVATQRPLVDDSVLTAGDVRPYESRNYEAQQPPLYYELAAPLAGGSAARELRKLRLFSALLAFIIVLASASILWSTGAVANATHAVAAAVLITSLPTWITLVIRASNDALACALVAVAIAITATAPRGWRVALEGAMWALAIAAKIYVWPLGIVFPIFWRLQRGSRARFAIVVIVCATAALLTMHDLSTRTHNAVGDFGFDKPAAHGAPQPIDWKSMLKITAASMVWTSGQHADALRPLAMLLYVLPLLALMRLPKNTGGGLKPAATLAWRIATAAAIAAFALAQIVNAAAFVRQARAAGLALPLGGKEGWYWYVLAPLLIAVFARHLRLAAIWLVAWDIFITEGALFHDFAGATSAAAKSAFSTWGPLHAPFTADLTGIAVGPLAAHLIALRAVHVAALTTGLSLVAGRWSLVRSRSGDEPPQTSDQRPATTN